MHRLTRVVGACAIAATMAFASHAMTTSAAGSTVVVTPAHTQGWSTADTRPGGMVNYVTDTSADAPYPPGALQLTTTDVNAKAQYMHAANAPLSGAELSYWTKQNTANFPGGDPSYQLVVDLTGSGGYTTLVYEPYQNGTVTPGYWQQWNVAAGQVWSTHTVTCPNGTVTGNDTDSGAELLIPLTAIETACPNAVVLGFGVNVGTYNPGYNVETDGIDFNGTVYNFELSNEPTSKDQCKDGGWQNLTDANGNPFKNQGQCVSYSNHS